MKFPTMLFALALSLGLPGCKAATNGFPTDDGGITLDLSAGPVKCERADEISCPSEDCVDVKTNPRHCGACEKACSARETCANGSCACKGVPCTGTTVCCADGCIDVSSDPKNCGVCARSCKPMETCASGECKCGTGATCASGMSCCGGGCIDTRTDQNNCGDCGNMCPAGSKCMAGACTCPPCGLGESCCNGTCTNLFNDKKNCKACGMACPPTVDFLGKPYPAKCVLGLCLPDLPNDGGMPAPDM